MMVDTSRIKQLTVYNAFGLVQTFGAGIYEELKDSLNNNSSKVQNIRVSGDPVSKIPETSHYGKKTEVEYCFEHLDSMFGIKSPADARLLHSIIKYSARGLGCSDL